VGIGFPFVNQLLGHYSFVPFAVVLLATFIFTYIYLPETLGRTVQEIEALANGSSPQKSGGSGSGGYGTTEKGGGGGKTIIMSAEV